MSSLGMQRGERGAANRHRFDPRIRACCPLQSTGKSVNETVSVDVDDGNAALCLVDRVAVEDGRKFIECVKFDEVHKQLLREVPKAP